MLRAQLIEDGERDDHIEVIPNEPTAVSAALDRASEGDLVVIFGDDIERCWKQVTGFEVEDSKSCNADPETLVQSFVEEDPEAFMLDPESELIRDERGVRIARIDEESD